MIIAPAYIYLHTHVEQYLMKSYILLNQFRALEEKQKYLNFCTKHETSLRLEATFSQRSKLNLPGKLVPRGTLQSSLEATHVNKMAIVENKYRLLPAIL